MPDVETRLARLRESADATVFGDVEVGEELRERVHRAAAAGAPQAGLPATRGTGRGLRLALAAAVVAAAAVAGLELRPGGAPAATASLTVKPAGAAVPVAVLGAVDRSGAEAIPLGGAGETELLPVEIDTYNALYYRWSPDGTRLAYGNRGDLHVYDARTGESVNVTNTPDRWELMPAWSPDGRLLAFTSRELGEGEGPADDGQWQLNGVFGGSPAVVAADGSGYRVLEGGTTTSPPSWSPDGRELAYAVAGRIHVQELAGGRTAALSPSAEYGIAARFVGAPSWSPARRELAVFFSEDDREPSREQLLAGTAPRTRQGYAVLDLDGRSSRVVFAYRAPFVPRQPAAWSSEGDFVALAFRPETVIAEPVGLVVVGRDGGVALERDGLFSQVAFDPRAPRLAARDEERPSELLVFSRDGKEWRTTTLSFAGDVDGFAWGAGGG